jgi:hypothetical protein
VHKLTAGAATADGMWFAKVDEREGTFLISDPDLNALKLPLVPVSAASPTASASPSPQVVPSPVAAPTATP